jgi:hypothetical protein
MCTIKFVFFLALEPNEAWYCENMRREKKYEIVIYILFNEAFRKTIVEYAAINS